VISVAVTAQDAEGRVRDTFLGLGTSAWLGYTYLYPTLAFAHSTLPTCPFLLLTGHPCPFCGGTRSFSAMWRGDILHAARLYPFGPVLFLLAFPVAIYGLWALTTGRSVSITLRPSIQKAITVVGVLALAASWSLKLFWLGN